MPEVISCILADAIAKFRKLQKVYCILLDERDERGLVYLQTKRILYYSEIKKIFFKTVSIIFLKLNLQHFQRIKYQQLIEDDEDVIYENYQTMVSHFEAC